MADADVIKSQLLCQLSYAPTVGNLPAGQFVIVTFSAARVIDAFSWRTTHESIERYSITHESADRIVAGTRRSSSRARSQRPHCGKRRGVYERCLTSAASPLGFSLTTGRRGGKESGPILGRFSTVPITGASSSPSA